MHPCSVRIQKIYAEHKKNLKMENFPFFFIENPEDAKRNKVNLIESCDDSAELSIGEPTDSSVKPHSNRLIRPLMI